MLLIFYVGLISNSLDEILLVSTSKVFKKFFLHGQSIQLYFFPCLASPISCFTVTSRAFSTILNGSVGLVFARNRRLLTLYHGVRSLQVFEKYPLWN